VSVRCAGRRRRRLWGRLGIAKRKTRSQMHIGRRPDKLLDYSNPVVQHWMAPQRDPNATPHEEEPDGTLPERTAADVLALDRELRERAELLGSEGSRELVYEVNMRAAAGIAWRVHPHTLRHTFATDLLEETGDLALVQDALGHADPGTTRIYAKVRNSRLARAMTRRKQEQSQLGANDDEIAALKRQVAELTAKLEALTKRSTHRDR
jgi:hypothetical protein